MGIGQWGKCFWWGGSWHPFFCQTTSLSSFLSHITWKTKTHSEYYWNYCNVIWPSDSRMPYRMTLSSIMIFEKWHSERKCFSQFSCFHFSLRSWRWVEASWKLSRLWACSVAITITQGQPATCSTKVLLFVDGKIQKLWIIPTSLGANWPVCQEHLSPVPFQA